MAVVFCNNEIKDIKYSGYTITKVYGCDGELVYVKDQPTPCQTSSLPTPFVLNYNTKVYDSSTYTIPMTSGQTNNIDCVLTGDVQNIVAYQDHISLANTTNVKSLVSGVGQFNNHCCITIVAKAVNPSATQGNDLLVNRTTSGYNWMFRWANNKVVFHGASQVNGVAVSSSEPNIVSVIAGSNQGVRFRNHTTSEDVYVDDFTFGESGLTSGGTMFAEYADDDNRSHFWKGDFYWIYMTDRMLTLSQIEKIIEYNESCFGVMFAWRKAPATDYACDTTTHTKYYKEYYEYSMDSGTTWNRVYPTSSRTSEDVIEYNSEDCGYVIPRKCQLIYSNSSTYDVSCDTGSTLTQNNVRGNQSQSYTDITDAVMGNCATVIGVSAFTNCSSLSSVTLNDNVTNIGNRVFYGCHNLTELTIPDSVTSLGDWSMGWCHCLTGVTIGNGITKLPGSIFRGDSGLTDVTIGSGVTSIGYVDAPNGFYGCTHLVSLTIYATTPPTLHGTTFQNTNDTFQIYVPAESVEAYKIDNYWGTFASRIQAIQ